MKIGEADVKAIGRFVGADRLEVPDISTHGERIVHLNRRAASETDSNVVPFEACGGGAVNACPHGAAFNHTIRTDVTPTFGGEGRTDGEAAHEVDDVIFDAAAKKPW